MNAPANAIIEHPDFVALDSGSDSGPDAGPDRRTVFTPEFKARFLQSLAEFGNVGQACKRGCVSRQTAYRERRRRPAFARMWDAALLAARTHAEGELADRAIYGVEEPVFYHGEEVGRRRRFSDRLLLAHLARLDRLEARGDMAGALGTLDDAIDALARGEELREEPGEEIGAGDGPETGAGSWAGGTGDTLPQDSVPHVPLAAAEPLPCAVCGGPCDVPYARLEPDHCMWLGNRIDRMEAARPARALTPSQLAEGTGAAEEIEAVQLGAYECGLESWWEVLSEEELDARLEALEVLGAVPGLS